MTIHSNDDDAFANAYVNIADWINKGGAEGQVYIKKEICLTSSNNYRRNIAIWTMPTERRYKSLNT